MTRRPSASYRNSSSAATATSGGRGLEATCRDARRNAGRARGGPPTSCCWRRRLTKPALLLVDPMVHACWIARPGWAVQRLDDRGLFPRRPGHSFNVPGRRNSRQKTATMGPVPTELFDGETSGWPIRTTAAGSTPDPRNASRHCSAAQWHRRPTSDQNGRHGERLDQRDLKFRLVQRRQGARRTSR